MKTNTTYKFAIVVFYTLLIGPSSVISAQSTEWYATIGINHHAPLTFRPKKSQNLNFKPAFGFNPTFGFSRRRLDTDGSFRELGFGLSFASVSFIAEELRNAYDENGYGVYHHRGISMLYGSYVYNRKFAQRWSWGLGGDLSLRAVQSLNGFFYGRFDLIANPNPKFLEVGFPLMLRPIMKLSYHFKSFRTVSSSIELAFKPSFQNYINGTVIHRDENEDKVTADGNFNGNFTALALTYRFSLSQKEHSQLWALKPVQNKRKNRSASGVRQAAKPFAQFQIFLNKPTEYFIPNVPDSFTVKGFVVPTAEYSIGVDLPLRNQWELMFSVHFGRRDFSASARVEPAFTRFGQGIEPTLYSYTTGPYFGGKFGFNKKFGRFNNRFALATTFVTKDGGAAWISEQDPNHPFADFYPIVIIEELPEEIIGPFSLGLEYNPEIVLRPDKVFNIALGIVGQVSLGYTDGGHITVTNGRTTYYGDWFQKLAKYGGITCRVIFNPNNRK